uniref:Uncharacterized protein n=1 Tax=Aegilops tauschii subsp. strangulata TaxID=200361 RepID=A0A453QPC9_AEGTS
MFFLQKTRPRPRPRPLAPRPPRRPRPRPLPVAASYLSRRAHDPSAPVVLTLPRILLAAVGLGLATGADDFLYAYGLSFVPVSTSAILISMQLAFTVFFVCTPWCWGCTCPRTAPPG